jgi:hypothetical protein
VRLHPIAAQFVGIALPFRLENQRRLHFFSSALVACTDISVVEATGGSTLTRDHARFQALGCNFLVKPDANEIVVEVVSDQTLPPFFETRITEALQFVLARSLQPHIIVREETGRERLELYSAMRQSKRTLLELPLADGYEGFQECFWILFSRYLEYVNANSSSKYWHACSYHLHNACEANANSILGGWCFARG